MSEVIIIILIEIVKKILLSGNVDVDKYVFLILD